MTSPPQECRKLRAEPPCKLPKRGANSDRGHLGVNLHRHGALAVSQDLHRHARMDIERRQHGPARLPGAVHGDPGHSRPHDAAIEAADEVTRFDRRPMTGSEHQAGIDPGIPSPLTVGVLLLPAELERGEAQVREGKRASDASVLVSRRKSWRPTR